MATGDSPEMQRMQEEAIRRAREMQRRATAAPEAEGHSPEESQKREESGVPENSEDSGSEGSMGGLPGGELMENLFKDKDRTLILMLLILIGGESENNELMFALLFLLM